MFDESRMGDLDIGRRGLLWPKIGLKLTKNCTFFINYNIIKITNEQRSDNYEGVFKATLTFLVWC